MISAKTAQYALAYGVSKEVIIKLLLDTQRVSKAHIGVRFSWKSAWVGLHYSPYNRRLCLNLLPFCTLYWVRKGGLLP